MTLRHFDKLNDSSTGSLTAASSVTTAGSITAWISANSLTQWLLSLRSLSLSKCRNINHELLMCAVKLHVTEKWILLYMVIELVAVSEPVELSLSEVEVSKY